MNFTVKTKQNTLISIRNIYCIGRNYHAHAAELNSKVPKQPFFFQKSISSGIKAMDAKLQELAN